MQGRLCAEYTAPRHGAALLDLRSLRAGAGAAARPDLPRAPDPDRAARPRRLPRLSPGRAPHAGHSQPGPLAERVPGRRRAAHATHALRAVRVRAAAAPSAAPD